MDARAETVAIVINVAANPNLEKDCLRAALALLEGVDECYGRHVPDTPLAAPGSASRLIQDIRMFVSACRNACRITNKAPKFRPLGSRLAPLSIRLSPTEQQIAKEHGE